MQLHAPGNTPQNGGAFVTAEVAVSAGAVLATVVAVGEQRAEAAARLELALSESDVLVRGSATSRAWLRGLLARTEVRSERILPPADRGELLEIPVEIAVSCEIRQLVDLLARLESAPKLLPVQELKIRVVNMTQPKDLLVTLTVSGFLLPSAPGKAKS